MLLLEISGFGWSSKGDKGYPENTRHLLILKCPKKPEEIQTTSLFPEQRQCLQPSSKSYPGELGSKLETIISSIQFSRSVVSDSLRPHESQHARPPCPSPSPRVHSNSHPTSRWCHPAVLSSVVPFSSCPQSLPASVFSNESAFRMRWPKYWSFSFSIIPSKEHPGLISFRMGWLDLLAAQGTLKSLLQHHSSKASILQCSTYFIAAKNEKNNPLIWKDPQKHV